jgi:WD40 repeat protein/mono/diheme cytochrome c family protein
MKTAAALLLLAAGLVAQDKAPAAKVSYDRQIRPLFQAQCLGCHQPSKAKGEYVMTSFDRLLKAGESKKAPIVAGKPDQSHLVELITPKNGEAEMPKKKPPMHAAEIDLVKRWIAEGAVDDSPVTAKTRFDVDHPPIYIRAPVLPALDFSPDGALLAIAGFHEVLLFKADGSERVARLIGLSERVESVRFSPDGKKLAVSGGVPARAGEIQVWDVEKKALDLSVPATFDTTFGVSWSPDGSKIAFGCTDKTVRAIDAKTGEQILYQGAHEDWVLGTVFSKDGSHVISVGRDRTTKLTEVATQRFVDNVSSITPAALKGGLAAVARHPERDEIVIGGADGQPRVYRMFRLVNRVIGDDSNIIRELPPMLGRIYSIAVSRDGKRIAAGSGLDGKGEVSVYGYEFDTKLPDNIKGIMGKVSTSRSGAENEALEKYKVEGVKRLAHVKIDQGIVYAVAIRPDGKVVATAGGDGVVRLLETDGGKLLKEFSPAPVDAKAAVAGARNLDAAPKTPDEIPADAPLPAAFKVAALEVQPASVALAGRFDYAQLVVTARAESGETADVTRLVKVEFPGAVEVGAGGLVKPKADGSSEIKVSLQGKTAAVAVTMTGQARPHQPDFIRDVNPVLSRLGCNAGTCHGAQAGKNGFKLSLRGYDAVFDIRALTDDLGSRRTVVASPDDSLMLSKPSGASPHEGGVLFKTGDPSYRILRDWIANGAKLDLSVTKVAKIEIAPANPVVQRAGQRQQVRVLATYADGKTRDVTREAFVESGNTEVATSDRTALMTAIRRGEAPILARYEGAYAATTLTVMGDRDGFAWEAPPAWTKIDELAAEKWKRLKIKPSDVCSDAEFIRRAAIDVTGLPPSADEVRAFLADARDAKAKREELVDKLVGSPAYVEHMTNKWADLLQVNRKFLGSEGASAFRGWIREQIEKNTPYDEFARRVVNASGSNLKNPPASYFKVLRDPALITENTTHLFLGVRFNCNKCHDHPFERWNQNQYYETAAFFARVALAADPESKGKNLGGTAFEGAKPLYEIVSEKADGEIKHERTGLVAPPKFPFEAAHAAGEKATRRETFAAWLTSKDNAYFARSYVNRLWGYLFGRGIIEPIDDIRAGNPAVMPEVLDFLTQEFVKSNFDTRHVLKLILKSRIYHLSIAANDWNKDDKINFSRFYPRRLPAEALYDAVIAVTGSTSRLPGGKRAAELPDSGVELPSGFLATFGRPARESSCECERSSDLKLGAVMSLVNGEAIADAIGDPGNAIAKLVAAQKDDAKVVEELFMRILNRPATPKEVATALEAAKTIEAEHAKLQEALAKREADWVKKKPELEKLREELMAKTKDEIAAFEKEIAPRVAEEEKKRLELVAQREKELAAYEADAAKHIAEAEKKMKAGVEWTPLVPTTAKAANGTKLLVQPDLSIRAVEKKGKGAYTVEVETRLKGVTGLRLEMLSDEKLPGKGPGWAGDGNFVLTEFEVKARPAGDPKAAPAGVALQAPQASFQQDNFGIASAIDGNATSGSTGWAVSPAAGITHWATFELKEPLGHEGGTVLTFTLHQNFNSNEHSVGRFRISATTGGKPGLSLSDELRAILATPAADRDDAQKAGLAAYYGKTDKELVKRRTALGQAKQPLPIDPHLKSLQEKLAYVSRPVVEDVKLVRMRKDVEQSAKQAAQARLTMAQDVAWSLINNSSFLFNR